MPSKRIVLGLVGVAIAGCGGADAGSGGGVSSPTAAPGFPVTVRDAGGTVTFRSAPRRVVSLSPTATETLFAVGAGRQVVAVDEESDYPKQAPRTKISPSQPNVEAIAGYRPDLVVVSDTSPADLVRGLRKLGVKVLAEPSAQTLGDAYDQILDLGAATGHRARATAVVAHMRSRLNRLFATAPSGAGLSLYYELSPDLYSAASDTFIGRIYKRLGLRNIADPAARKAHSPYPQLSPEYVVSADPDLVVLADAQCCKQSAATVGARPGWSKVAAVKQGHVVAVDADLASRWGPRLPQFVQQVVASLRKVRG